MTRAAVSAIVLLLLPACAQILPFGEDYAYRQLHSACMEANSWQRILEIEFRREGAERVFSEDQVESAVAWGLVATQMCGRWGEGDAVVLEQVVRTAAAEMARIYQGAVEP